MSVMFGARVRESEMKERSFCLACGILVRNTRKLFIKSRGN